MSNKRLPKQAVAVCEADVSELKQAVAVCEADVSLEINVFQIQYNNLKKEN